MGLRINIPENLVNIKRVIQELDVSKATIYNRFKKGVIESKKIGRKVLFDLNAIINSLKTNEHTFGAGRHYSHAYTAPAAKAEHQYYFLKNKLDKGRPISKEDEAFYIDFKKNIPITMAGYYANF